MKIDGGCHCGAIRYEAEIDPGGVGICHCTDCQKLSGSAFRTVVPAASDTFRMTAGEPTIYVKTGDSGAKRQQAFCPRSGSPIFSASSDPEPKIYMIRAGTIRGSLLSLSASECAESQTRLAGDVRSLRERMGAVSDGMAEVYESG